MLMLVLHIKMLSLIQLSRGWRFWEELLRKCVKDRWMRSSRWNAVWKCCVEMNARREGARRRRRKRRMSERKHWKCFLSSARTWTMQEVCVCVCSSNLLVVFLVTPNMCITSLCVLQIWWSWAVWICVCHGVSVTPRPGFDGGRLSSLPAVPRTCRRCSSTCSTRGRCWSSCNSQIMTQTAQLELKHSTQYPVSINVHKGRSLDWYWPSFTWISGYSRSVWPYIVLRRIFTSKLK